MAMPKQKKSEAKQDYLKRCTEARMRDGDNVRKAYSTCAAAALGEDGDAMFLRAPVTLEVEGEGKEKKRTFLMTAKTGIPVVRYGYTIAIDIKGIRTEKKMPVLRQHEHDRIVGHGGAYKDGDSLYVEGEFSQSTPDAVEVLALADEGYPWQSSIGIWAEVVNFLEAGVKMKVNGLEIEGPAEIWKKSYVREASFVSLGADPDTAAIALENDSQTSINYTKENNAMKLNIETLKTDHPELFEEVKALGVAEGTQAGIETGTAQGVEAERTRVKSLLDSGADDNAIRLAIDEGTDPQVAYKVFFEAEKKKRVDALATLKDNAVDTQGQNTTQTDGPRPFLDLVAEYQAEKKCSKAEAMKVIAAKYPESHDAFLKK